MGLFTSPIPDPPAHLAREEKDRAAVQHSIAALQKDMVRLSSLITDKRGEQERLVQSNVLMENDFVHALKVGGS